MKKLLLIVSLLLFVSAANAQTNKIVMKMWIQCAGTGTFLVTTDTLNEGEVYTLTERTLTGNFASAQPLYDALVETDFRFTHGSLNEDIELWFILSNINCDSATYFSGLLGENFFFHAKFIVFVDGNEHLGDYNLGGGGALLRLKKTPEFQTFFSSTGIDPAAALSFAFADSNGYTTIGITTLETDSTIEASISHFSTIVGGEKSVLSDVEVINNEMPSNFYLTQNYPNPFNPSTKIYFSIPERSNVELNVYNLLGVKVAMLAKGYKEAGNYEVTFEANNLPSGLYLYELKTGQFSQTKKMLLLK
jgi:hypothetical protein